MNLNEDLDFDEYFNFQSEKGNAQQENYGEETEEIEEKDKEQQKNYGEETEEQKKKLW
jgi:hypothetical protein